MTADKPTPRTEELIAESAWHKENWPTQLDISYDFARQLERELASVHVTLGRLRELAKDANDLLDDARSGYIGGCSEDLKWDKRREEFRNDYCDALEKS